MNIRLLANIFGLLVWTSAGMASAADFDGDGIDDSVDNCLEEVNPEQTNTDNDAFGNRCDPDFDNNGRVDFADLATLKAGFFGTDPLLDLSGDGRTDFADLSILKSMFFTAPGPGALAPGRKNNAGHYTALIAANDGDQAFFDSVKPGMKGIVKRYPWRDLEPTEGQYDFSQIESDLMLVASQGMQLIVLIVDKTFQFDAAHPIPTPDYLSGDQHIRPNKPGGFTAVRWSPLMLARMNALIVALGNRFDANPNFEGIATQESAPGMETADRIDTGYTPEKYRDALISCLTSATQSMPHSRVFWSMNFLPDGQSYLSDIASAVQSLGVVMGGPDVLPDSDPLIRLTYPLYTEFNGKMPLFTQVEQSVYRHEHEGDSFPTKYWTMPEIFEFSRDDLHVNYIFWVRVATPNPIDSYSWWDALPIIEANPVINP